MNREITIREIIQNSDIQEVVCSEGEVSDIIFHYGKDGEILEEFHLVANGDNIIVLDRNGKEIISQGKILGKHLPEDNDKKNGDSAQ